ncbi:MAG TPA: hydroxymethylbilane synthase [Vicinamibacterales bacterium]|jgi:hydroxymethylbilane synthase|nr:hydroxymethylbilane synthase [Vicinamibacterales bacterium]
MATLRLGTRGSALALVQARTVAALLQARTGTDCEIVVIKTSGDRMADARLSEIGGKGLFVKEIEEALLAGTIDLAVHSSKDMPAQIPDGLEVRATLPREDPRDALVLPAPAESMPFDDAVRRLGASSRVGTSSVRRVAQLTALLPHAQFVPFRGNLDTRLRKLDQGDVDAIVLAAAGLRRLEQAGRISAFVPPDVCVPAPGQGIVAVEIRVNDAATAGLVDRIGDRDALDALHAERAVVAGLGGGCQMPIGAHATISGDRITLAGVVIAPDGSRAARATADGPRSDAAAIGRQAAERLLAGGADDILSRIRATDHAGSSRT